MTLSAALYRATVADTAMRTIDVNVANGSRAKPGAGWGRIMFKVIFPNVILA